MAPGPPGKRGRSRRVPDASRADPDASSTQKPSNKARNEYETKGEGQKRPGKPGKATKGPEPTLSAIAPPENPPPRKGGRPAPEKGRKAATGADGDAENVDGNRVSLKRKRGRPSLQKTSVSKDAEDERDQALEQEAPRPRKRGGASLQELPPSEAQNKTARKSQPGQKNRAPIRRGTVNATPKKTGGRPSGGRKSQEGQSPAAGSASQSKTTRRRSSSNAEADDLPSPPRPYPHIAAQVHRVSRATIEAKWSALEVPSRDVAETMLQSAKLPILQRVSTTEKRRGYTDVALEMVSRRIVSKLKKGLPFPPAAMPPSRGVAGIADGREAELDFENVLNGKMALERQLDPGVHAVKLLEREKERMEEELEKDYEKLRSLESDARGQAREHRGLLKKAHVLAPKTAGPRDADEDPEFRDAEDDGTENMFKNPEDEDIQILAARLSDHTDSLRTNLQQAEGIMPQLARSRAALQDVLLSHLDQKQYEEVLFG